MAARDEELAGRDVLAFLRDRVAKWWLPDRVEFLSEIPKTSVGKFDKKELRGLVDALMVADGDGKGL